jgi:hypothetical protein
VLVSDEARFEWCAATDLSASGGISRMRLDLVVGGAGLVIQHRESLRIIYDFERAARSARATVRNASMRGVGTIPGTAGWGDPVEHLLDHGSPRVQVAVLCRDQQHPDSEQSVRTKTGIDAVEGGNRRMDGAGRRCRRSRVPTREPCGQR